jgi:hypothetical protein
LRREKLEAEDGGGSENQRKENFRRWKPLPYNG